MLCIRNGRSPVPAMGEEGVLCIVILLESFTIPPFFYIFMRSIRDYLLFLAGYEAPAS